MNNAILAIDDDRIAVFRQRGNAGDLAHHRNAHGAGNDHHMAGNGPIFENKSADRSPWIVKQFRCPHGAGHDDGVLRQTLAAGHKTGQLPEQPVGEVVEIMQPLAQIGIRHVDHAGSGVALHLLHRRLAGQSVADRFLELAHPAAIMGKHPVGFENRPVLAFHRHVAP
jgi:hypothetical protein